MRTLGGTMRGIKFAVAAVMAIGIIEATYNIHIFLPISIFLYSATVLLWMKDVLPRSRVADGMAIPLQEIRRLRGYETVKRRTSALSVAFEQTTTWARVLVFALWVLAFCF